MPSNALSRRVILTGAILSPLLTIGSETLQAQDQDVLNRDNVLRDPANPVLGNLDGDVSLVEYYDYQCPYCKTVAVEIDKLAREDGKIRLVFKDWPIFGEPSRQAATLVLAAHFQNKYAQAHRAVISMSEKLTSERLLARLRDAEIDIDRAQSDLEKNRVAIDALLSRNDAQAKAFGFRGTPSFIIGTFRVPGVPTGAQFRQIVADVRAGKDKR
jgi:protein-disulfide isomerase